MAPTAAVAALTQTQFHIQAQSHPVVSTAHTTSAQQQQCEKYKYVVTATGPKIVPVPDPESREEEAAADYNAGGYLAVHVGDVFKNGRYVVLRKLGWGHFSTVWLIKDTDLNKHAALKVVKSAGRYAETARDEIMLLRKVMSGNPQHPGRDFIVSLFDSFTHAGPEEMHICIVCEPLGENLLALIERNKAKGVSRELVKVIAKQILLGLQYLHDECDLVHTDIKPENILISIPEVETLIATELSTSPPPTSRRVGVPPGKIHKTGGVIIPPKKSRDKQVQIFDSQPLPSPTTGSLSRSASRGSRKGLTMSQMTSPQSANGMNSLSATGLVGSAPSCSSMPASIVSSVASTSVVSTPPTSLGSTLSKDDSPTAETSQKAVHSSLLITPKEAPIPKQAATGPSLLAQTAPQNLKNHPTPSLSDLTVQSSSPLDETIQASATPSIPSVTGGAPPIHVKIADLGNATPSRIHFTEDIQTRQYRAPEAILGRSDWDHTVDMWSVACVIFELLTAEYLFEPQAQGAVFSKDDDHMAQIIELLGDFPLDVKAGGRFSREIFDSTGHLRYIKTLKPWPLKKVLTEKYLFTENDSKNVCDFLEPMLRVDFRARARAADMIDHPWLSSQDEAQDVVCV